MVEVLIRYGFFSLITNREPPSIPLVESLPCSLERSYYHYKIYKTSTNEKSLLFTFVYDFRWITISTNLSSFVYLQTSNNETLRSFLFHLTTWLPPYLSVYTLLNIVLFYNCHLTFITYMYAIDFDKFYIYWLDNYRTSTRGWRGLLTETDWPW